MSVEVTDSIDDEYTPGVFKVLKYVWDVCRMCKNVCDTFEIIYLDMCCKKLSRILKDDSHSISNFIVRSPKSGRILHITSKRIRFLN